MPVGLPVPPDEQQAGNFVFRTLTLDEDPHPISVETFDVAGNNYEVWDDEGSDTAVGPTDSQTDYPMPAGTSLEAAAFFGANRVIFRSDGTCNASGQVQITNGEFSRQISILASTGKITVATP